MKLSNNKQKSFWVKSTSLRYFMVGFLVLISDYFILNLLHGKFGIGLLFSATIAFVCGSLTGFLFHSQWTFKYELSNRKILKFSHFILVGVVGLITTDLIIYIFTINFDLQYNLSKTIAVIVSIAWAYLANRWWVFSKRDIIRNKNNYIKILEFCPYYTPHTGGLISHTEEFDFHLSGAGRKITIFTPHLIANLPRTEDRTGIKIIRFPAFEIVSNYPLPKIWSPKFWKACSQIFKDEYDLVISRTRFFLTSFMAIFYARYKQLPYVHIEHGSDYAKLNSRIESFLAFVYDHTFGKTSLRFADVVVANSKATAIFCKKISPRINCKIIYRGIKKEEIELSKPNLEIKNKYPNDLIVVFIGRLIDGKGVSDLIDAIKDISNDNLKLFIIGDGPQKEALQELSKKLSLNKKVIFFGNKKFEEVIGVLKISDIFVNPSYTEGLPTSVIEAALCKKAIIATNVGGTPEIITDNKSGYLIEPRNIGLLKEKLEILINNKNLREQFGASAYDEVKDKFNWNKSIDKYLEIFSELKNT